MFGMNNPGVYPRVDIVEPHRSCAPSVAKAAQAIVETSHIVFREATATVGVQLETEKLRRRGA